MLNELTCLAHSYYDKTYQPQAVLLHFIHFCLITISLDITKYDMDVKYAFKKPTGFRRASLKLGRNNPV